MRYLAVGLSTLIWALPAVAADKPEFGPIPSWVQPVTAPPTMGTSTDAAVKIQLQDQQFNFAPSADESYFESVVRIQTPQGLAAMGTISLPWKPDCDVLTVHKLYILRGDQVIDVLGAGQTFTILRRENHLEYSALDGILTATIQPAGLQIGDAIDLAFSVRRIDPVLAGTSERIVGGWPNLPISHLRVRARWATRTSIRWKASDAVTGVREKRSGDMTEVTLALDDAEPLLQPKGAPLRFHVDRQIEFSGFKSWAEVASRLAPLYERAASLSPQSPLHAEIARIKAASADPSSRAAAALTLVQNQVRYVFLGMNDGALVPADADLTWSRRFGDCKAKTALLLALLHAMNIDAEPVAVNTVFGDGLNLRLPMIGLFNHVLVRAVVHGNTYWLDATRTADRRLERLTVPNFSWGLPLVPKGSDLLKIVPVPLTQPTVATTVRIDATAGIRIPAPIHVDTTFSGDSATALKLSFGNLTAGDLDRALRDYWSKAYDFVDIQSVAGTFDEDTGDERLTMDGVARMDWSGNRYETDKLGLGYKADFTRPPGPNRNAPFAVPFPVYNVVRETIELPYGGRRFSLKGGNIDRTVAGVAYRRSVSIDGGEFKGEASQRSVMPEFPAVDAEAAQRALREMASVTVYVQAPSDYVLTEQEVAAELAKTPETADGYIDRGNLLLDRDAYDRAIADFSKAINMDPKSAMALADRGMAYLHKHDNVLARRDFDAAFAIDSRNPVVFRGRGMLELDANHIPEAIAAFTSSLELKPHNAYSLEKRALAYAQVGDKGNALADSAEVIRLRPRFFDMYAFRADIFRKEGNADMAIREAESLTTANPDDARALIVAGAIYGSVKKYSEAMDALNRAIEIAPIELNYLTRARYRPKTDIEGKRADIDSALKLNPRSARALAMRARMQSDAGEYADAIATFGAAMAIGGASYDLLTDRGIAYFKSFQVTLAERDFAAARQKGTSALAHNNMCWNMATAGVNLGEALSECDAAVAKAPDEAAYIDSRGFVLLKLARYDESIAAYDVALKIWPTLAASLYGRGIAKRRRGDAKAAADDIQEALAADASVAETFAGYGITP